MNLFRSEEHARRWDGFDDRMESSLLSVNGWAEIFANPIFRQRGRRDYLSWIRSDEGAAAYQDLRARLPRLAT